MTTPPRRPVTQPAPKTIRPATTASEQGLFYLFGGGLGVAPTGPEEAHVSTQGRRACKTPAAGFEVLFGQTAFSASAQVASKAEKSAEKPAGKREESQTPKPEARPSEPAAAVQKSPLVVKPSRMPVHSPAPVCITTAPTLQRICQNLGLNPGKDAPPRKSLPAPPRTRSTLSALELVSETKDSWKTKGKAWRASMSELDIGLGRWRDHVVKTGNHCKDWDEEEAGRAGAAFRGDARAQQGGSPDAYLACLPPSAEPPAEASAKLVADTSFSEKAFVEDRMFSVSGLHLFGHRRAQEAYRSLQQDLPDQPSDPSNSASPSISHASPVGVESEEHGSAFFIDTADQARGISPCLSFSSSFPNSPRSPFKQKSEREAELRPDGLGAGVCAWGVSTPPARATSPPEPQTPTGLPFPLPLVAVLRSHPTHACNAHDAWARRL